MYSGVELAHTNSGCRVVAANYDACSMEKISYGGTFTKELRVRCDPDLVDRSTCLAQ
jgi:hypothetical protein